MNYPNNKRPPRTVPGSADDILAFLDKHGTQNKDAFAEKEPTPAKTKIDKGKGGVPRMTLDLHGRTGDQATMRMRLTFESCRHHGVKELLIVHGQGRHSNPLDGPVLKNLVHAMLENELALQVRDSRPAIPRDGGDGATVVYLR